MRSGSVIGGSNEDVIRQGRVVQGKECGSVNIWIIVLCTPAASEGYLEVRQGPPLDIQGVHGGENPLQFYRGRKGGTIVREKILKVDLL